MARRVELNITKEQAADFINWLANDTFWGHTYTRWHIEHGREEVEFVINGHTLSNYSNQHHHVLIDRCYCPTAHCGVTVAGKRYLPIEYCLYRLGF